MNCSNEARHNTRLLLDRNLLQQLRVQNSSHQFSSAYRVNTCSTTAKFAIASLDAKQKEDIDLLVGDGKQVRPTIRTLGYCWR